MKKRIREYFRDNADEIRKKLLDLLSELVAVRTINAGRANLKDYPFMKVCGEESKAIVVLKRYLDKEGFRYSIHEKFEGRGNLITSYGRGGKVLCVGCHLDVVPPGDARLWDTDPFVMAEKDGYVYGRGTLDNKGPLVCSLIAMGALKKLNIDLNGTFMLAAIASEETHEKYEKDEPGIVYLLREGLLRPDYAIIPDVGENMTKMDIAEKGRLVINVTSKGRPAHGSTPELGINAVYKMAEFLARVEDLELTYKPHGFLGRPTINLGIIRGGDAANTVPATCVATLDVRYLPGQTAEGVVGELRKCTDGIEDGDFSFEVESNQYPHEIDPANILVRAIQSNCEEILGFRPEPFGMGGGTFAKFFNLGGITAVGFGPGDAEMAHVSNERIEIAQMMQFAELLACVSVDLLG